MDSPSPYATFDNHIGKSNEATIATGSGSGIISDKISGTRYSELR